jgi:hypothetical protein
VPLLNIINKWIQFQLLKLLQTRFRKIKVGIKWTHQKRRRRITAGLLILISWKFKYWNNCQSCTGRKKVTIPLSRSYCSTFCIRSFSRNPILVTNHQNLLKKLIILNRIYLIFMNLNHLFLKIISSKLIYKKSFRTIHLELAVLRLSTNKYKINPFKAMLKC